MQSRKNHESAVNIGMCATFRLIQACILVFLRFVQGPFNLQNGTGGIGTAVMMNFPPIVGAAMEATPSVMITENVLRWIVNTDFAAENIFFNFALNLMLWRVEETRVDRGESVSGSRPTFFLPVRQLRGFDLYPACHVNRQRGTNGRFV